ncbi:MAG TPA: hypothetical protein VHA70_04795 [Bauldia sp.]|nr:hypothetical protein [Bauldia sp.]
MRVAVYFALPFLVAVASILNIVAFRLSNLLREDWPPIVTLSTTVAVIVILAATGLVFSVVGRSKAVRRSVLAVALVVIVVAGFVPRGLDFLDKQQRQAQQQSDNADAEMQFQSDYLDRSDDVDQRIADKRPYNADEAMAFLEFAASADLTWRSLPDHTPEAFTLLNQALEGGILDPNLVMTNAPTADSPALTLTLAFFDKEIRPTLPRAVSRHAWEVVKMLVDHGADMSSPDAAALRDNITKTAVGEGRYIQLQ